MCINFTFTVEFSIINFTRAFSLGKKKQESQRNKKSKSANGCPFYDYQRLQHYKDLILVHSNCASKRMLYVKRCCKFFHLQIKSIRSCENCLFFKTIPSYTTLSEAFGLMPRRSPFYAISNNFTDELRHYFEKIIAFSFNR